MALKNYGVLKGHVIDRQLATSSSSHYQVHVIDNTKDFRIAINVFSKLSPSELLFYLDENFNHPITDVVTGFDLGFTPVKSQSGGAAIDFVRGHYFNESQMKVLPYDVAGPDNDLNEKLDKYILKAMEEEEAIIYAFGQRWGPEDKKDRYFGFTPGNGIHDIHMNQGNAPEFAKDDGVWQDGALLIYFPSTNQWIGFFLAFQSQSWHTDDTTGHTIGTTPDSSNTPTDPTQPVSESSGDVKIIAALVNPLGEDPGKESITLINTGANAATLDGWKLMNQNGYTYVLNTVSIAAGDCQRIMLPANTLYLGNNGGSVTLVNPNGQRVHGISYSKSQAGKAGRTLTF